MPIRESFEVWGGAECTICRIGDDWRDQGQETGHRSRLEDLDRIHDLGIRTIRLPILWERCAAAAEAPFEFTETDRWVSRAMELGFRVVGGLCHHGSGPKGTDLTDRGFADGLARFAAAVAARYPDVQDWTPVNEPLTTARFACLYGHWYPHRRDFPSFAKALVNECLATCRSMDAIRAVNPSARLLQTEDVGKCFATPALAYQADYENERRWLSLDLLFGRVDRRHPWHRRLLDSGILASVLAELRSARPPDLIGINYYPTSERFLDETRDDYPRHLHGGNERTAYADAEAIRVDSLAEDVGLLSRLRETWARYRTPLVVSECQHGCTREEQVRWFADCHAQCLAARDEGIDLRAITAWALFGSVDWRSLLTRREDHYDVGAYDVRSHPPRPTALAQIIRSYANANPSQHPVLDSPGWWRRPDRCYGWNGGPGVQAGRPILILGASGTLGQAFARICQVRGLSYRLTSRSDLDLSSRELIRESLDSIRPWAIINAAGYVRVDKAAEEEDLCFEANALGPIALSEEAECRGIPLVAFSSDLVFSGPGAPFDENSSTSPACTYGASKVEMERHLLASPRNLILRTAAFFGPWDRYNFAHNCISRLREKSPFEADRGTLVSPTYVPDLCHAALDLLIDRETGLWHLSNQGCTSWFDFARLIAAATSLPVDLVIASESLDRRDTSLDTRRARLLRPLEDAVADFAASIAP